MSRSIVVATLVVLVCLGLVTAPADATPPGVARDDLAAPGPFAVASTARIVPCAGPSAAEQNADARRQGARTALQCTTTQPVIGGPSNSIDFWYPTTAPGPRPLVVFVPGDGANPGYFAALARHWAGYGFVVAIATIRQEILPGSPSYGVRRALAAGRDPRSPMFGRIDTRSVILAGHSAGATKAIEAAGLDGASRRGVPTPADLTLPRGTRLTAVLALQPEQRGKAFAQHDGGLRERQGRRAAQFELARHLTGADALRLAGHQHGPHETRIEDADTRSILLPQGRQPIPVFI